VTITYSSFPHIFARRDPKASAVAFVIFFLNTTIYGFVGYRKVLEKPGSDKTQHCTDMAMLLLFVLHVATSALILLFTIIAIAFFFHSLRSNKNVKGSEKELYEDEDGIATVETQKAYSVKAQNVLATTVTGAGFAVAVVHAVMVSSYGGNWGIVFVDGWICVGIWVCFIPFDIDMSVWPDTDT